MTHKPFIVLLHFSNGYLDETHRFSSYSEALEFCRNGVSRTGSVVRIEIQEGASIRAMWDHSWNAESKATLFRDYR